MKNLICLLALLISLHSTAQTPKVVWNQYFGNMSGAGGQSFLRTGDGGHIILGVVYANGGDVSGYHGGSSDIWLAKVGAAGNVIWQKCFGGSAADLASGNGTGGGSLQATADGGYIFVGVTQSVNGDITKNHGGWDAWVVKVNGLGVMEWQRTYGGTGDELDFKISQSADGGYFMAGTTQSNSSGDVGVSHGLMDAWVVKLNATGDIQWQECLGSTNHEMMGGFSFTSDNGYLLALSAKGNDGDVWGNHKSGYYDYWVVKLDKNGVLVWQKCYGGNHDDIVLGICETGDGHMIAGYSYSADGDVGRNNGQADCWFIRIDDDGLLLWEQAYGGIFDDLAYGIQPSSDGGFAAVCTAETFGFDHGDIKNSFGEKDAWLLKLSASGALEWQQCLGGSDSDWGMQLLSLPGDKFELIGQSKSKDGTVYDNPWPNSVWITLVNGGKSLPVTFKSFKAIRDGNKTILDWKAEVTDGKEFLVERSIDAQHFAGVALVKYEAGRSEYRYTDALTSSASNTLYYRIVGIDLNNIRNVSNIVRVSGAKEEGAANRLLGNPVHDDLMMEVSINEPEQLRLFIYDMAGKLCSSGTLQAHKGQNIVRHPVEDLLPGVYTVQVSSSGKSPKPILRARFIKK